MSREPDVPLDHPMADQIENTHNIDRDTASTNLAVKIVNSALELGHPTNADAAEQTLTGAPAALALQATMEPFVQEAIGHDTAAHDHSLAALDRARAAAEAAARRAALPNESVDMASGSWTRGQVWELFRKLDLEVARRVGRGDLEHEATPPGWLLRTTVATASASIETGFLLWPVLAASWGDILSLTRVAAVLVLFIIVNDQLYKLAGHALRNAREALTATRELQIIGITRGRDGDQTHGREIIGEADEPLVYTTRRALRVWYAAVTVVLAIYGSVMFTRIFGLAEGLHRGTWFSVLAAALITAITLSAPLLMAWKWSRGNSLGRSHYETAVIIADTHHLLDDLREQALGAINESIAAADLAHAELDHADQVLEDGKRTCTIGAQKAADLLGHSKVLPPNPDNLHPPRHPLQTTARDYLDEAASSIRATRLLLETQPFPITDIAYPWKIRAGRRSARPNPAFVTSSQLGSLHDGTSNG